MAASSNVNDADISLFPENGLLWPFCSACNNIHHYDCINMADLLLIPVNITAPLLVSVYNDNNYS